MTRRWWKNAEPLYRRFAPESFVGRDAAEAHAMYVAETFGGSQPSPTHNRYAAGKRNLDLTVAMWREDIAIGMLMKFELLDDPTLWGLMPWLTRTLSRMMAGENVLLTSSGSPQNIMTQEQP